jgi:hypothetical protein
MPPAEVEIPAEPEPPTEPEPEPPKAEAQTPPPPVYAPPRTRPARPQTATVAAPVQAPPTPPPPQTDEQPAGGHSAEFLEYGHFKKDLQIVLSYMDKLLESLPDEKIEEFARSEQFDVYKKVFKELGLA